MHTDEGGDGGGSTTSFSDYVSKSLTDKSILQEKTKQKTHAALRYRPREEEAKTTTKTKCSSDMRI